MTLSGEPGVGKTRTVEEFIAACGAESDRVLWGESPESGGAPAYGPWLQALSEHFDRQPTDALRAELGEAGPDLARLIPTLRERLPDLAAAETLDPSESRFRLFDSIASLLARASRGAPLILVLDNLHWADADSLLLLEFVAREIRTMRLLVIVTAREAALRDPDRLGRIVPLGKRIALRGLARPEVERFLCEIIAAPPAAALVDELARTTDGNPSVLGAVVRVLRAEGRLHGERSALGPLRLPDQVRALIRRNLQPLSARDREVASAAAVIGREFDISLLQHVFGLPADELLAGFASAIESGGLEEVPNHLGRLRFTHGLVPETLYADLEPGERARLHRAIGEALEAQHAGRAEPPLSELAHHFLAAASLGCADKAIDYSARAAASAIARLGYQDAIQHLEHALKVLEAVGSEARAPARELELRLALGDACWRAGDYARARLTFEEAAQIAREHGDATALGRAALGVSQASPEVGVAHTRLASLLQEALDALGGGDSPLAASLLGRLAAALYFAAGDAERRLELSERAVAMARRVGDPAALARALLTRHFILWGPADGLAGRLAIVDEMIAIAERGGDRPLALEAHGWRILNLLEQGDLGALDEQIDLYTRLCEQSHLPLRRWHARLIAATRALIAGRYDEAPVLAAEAFALMPPGLGTLHAQFFASQLFFPYLERGRLGDLEPMYAFYAENLPALKMWRCTLALLHLRTGRKELAGSALDELAADGFASLPRDGNFPIALAELALIAADARDAERARLLYDLLLPWADRVLVIGLTAGCFGSAHRFLGLLAATAGRLDDAAAHFERALVVNGRIEARVWVAYTQLDFACLLLARESPGDRTRAAELVRAAMQTAAKLNLGFLASQLWATGQLGTAETGEPIVALLQREGEYWTVSLGGAPPALRVRDSKGFGYLAVLLRHPGHEFHSLELAGAERPADPAAVRIEGDAGEMLDPQARASYRRRLSELERQIEESSTAGSSGDRAALARERAMIERELARGVGIGGRDRKAASPAERARLNVTRALAKAVRELAQQNEALGRTLEAGVRTGLFCRYEPPPDATVVWRV